MSRIEKEKQTVEQMIRLYCRKKEGNGTLCPQCRELLEYAQTRLSRCPFGDGKSTCRICTVHCYKPEMRERMRVVMRWAGPRMLFYHPVAAIRHLWQEYIRRSINSYLCRKESKYVFCVQFSSFFLSCLVTFPTPSQTPSEWGYNESGTERHSVTE